MSMAWSFSRVQKFLLCPRAGQKEYIEGLPTVETEALRKGKEYHEELERCITGGDRKAPSVSFAMRASGLRMPKSKVHRKASLADGTEHPYTVERTDDGLWLVGVEVKVGITRQGRVVGFDSEECWYRGVIDLVKAKVESQLWPWRSAKQLEIYDWKTGSSSGNKKQLESYAVLLHLLYGVPKIVGHFVYVTQERKSKAIEFNLEECWNGLVADIQQAEAIVESGSFPATPNWTCERFCSFKSDCPAKVQRISIQGFSELGGVRT